MDRDQDLAAAARSVIESNLYMTLGTADEAGQPWVTPVYYVPSGYTEFYWVSSPEAAHSLNIAARPEVGVVIFDSRAPVNTGQGVYMSALAREVAGSDLDRGIEIFSGKSEKDGAGEWTRKDVRPPARLRLYRAIASKTFVLDPQDRRITVNL